MSKKEWLRLEAIAKVRRGEWTAVQAAEALGLSERQFRRLRRRVECDGEKALVHGNVGRAPGNKTASVIADKVLKLARSKFVGFNDTHLTEKLLDEGVELSRETIRHLLRVSGIGPARKRRPTKFRKRREREAQAGRMMLWDGSLHDWLEGRGPMICLVGAVDDATGELLPGVHFVERESSAAYLAVLKALVREKGAPWVVYQDRHASLKQNHHGETFEEELAGRREKTQVGRALDELGIRTIFALSPQAKGRVERMWGTLQDRLVSELRLAGARTIEEANVVIRRYRPHFNQRFARIARVEEQAWRPKPNARQLERICSFLYEVAVFNDNAVRWNRLVIDLPPGRDGRSWAGSRVELRHGLDGAVRLWRGDELILERRHATEAMPETIRKRHAKKFGTNRPTEPKLTFRQFLAKTRSHKVSTGFESPPVPPSETTTTTM